MSRARTLVKLLALGSLVAWAATLHHGHIQSFVLRVYDALKPRLPKRLQRHQWRARPSLLQVYFESPAVHYEVWVQRKTRSLEVGLHFEGEREANYRWAGALAPRAMEIQAQLGPGVELEEWTQKWTRLHETLPVPGNASTPVNRDLTDDLVAQVAERLARFIEVMEPILAEERPGVEG